MVGGSASYPRLIPRRGAVLRAVFSSIFNSLIGFCALCGGGGGGARVEPAGELPNVYGAGGEIGNGT